MTGNDFYKGVRARIERLIKAVRPRLDRFVAVARPRTPLGYANLFLSAVLIVSILFAWSRSGRTESSPSVQNASSLELHFEPAKPSGEQAGKFTAVPQATPDDMRLATEAYRLYAESQKHDEALAEVYLLNAVNHAPREYQYLKEYSDRVLNRPTSAAAELQRVQSVLELAIYRIEPSHVSEARKALDQIAAKLDGLAKEANAVQPPAEDPRTEFLRLKKSGDESLWRNPAQLVHHISELTSFQNTLEELEPRPSALCDEVSQEVRRWRQVSEACSTCNYLDQCLANLEGLTSSPSSKSQGTLRVDEQTISRAVPIVQAAENSLPALWGLPLKELPAQLQTKIAKYPGNINDWVDYIATLKAHAIVVQIGALNKKKDKPIDAESWESNCKELEENIRDAQKLYLSMPSPNSSAPCPNLVKRRDLAEGRLREMQDRLTRWRDLQYQAYQKWALERCQAAFDGYMSHSINVTQASAVQIFEDSEIWRIDLRYLDLHVSEVCHNLIQKLLAKMWSTKTFESQRLMAVGEKDDKKKLKLSDF